MSKKPQRKSSKKKQNAAKAKVGDPKSTGTPQVTGGARVVIITFAVVMALSMMLPSLSAVFSSDDSDVSQKTEQASSSDSSSSDDGSSSATSDDSASGVAAIDASYQKRVDPLTEKYDEDPKNLATLLNLGNAYMSWGVNVSYSSTDDDATAHAQDLFDQALDYYGQYLKLNDTEAVRVNVALCELYRGDTATAQSQLEALTESSPDYGPAWANLGMVYEVSGDTDSALAAYAKAIETDPDDEYGAKTYGETRTSSINSSGSSTTTSTVGQGLSDTLKSHDGTNL